MILLKEWKFLVRIFENYFYHKNELEIIFFIAKMHKK